MKLDTFYGSQRIVQLLKTYLDGIPDIEEMFKKKAEDIALRQCIIAVLGMQGCGKSSFLNALLFGDIVLPVDADETTCIPAEVSYGKNAAPSATVFFCDGREEKLECTERSLAEYIHQDHNPQNVKGVKKVVIRLNHPLLETGVTLVDLPGVGSITTANQQLTEEYLQQTTAAIFLLRTTPPITQTESVFIQSELPRFGYAFWLQNQWIDESAEEVQDSVEHNTIVLTDIAKRVHFPEDRIHAPDVVNIKKALDGKVRKQAAEVRDSGIDTFLDKLTAFSANWKKELEHSHYMQARDYLDSAIRSAEDKLKRLSGDVLEERKKIEKAKAEADKIRQQNREIAEKAMSFLEENEKSINATIKEKCKIAKDNLRNVVREAIENGIVGGEHLNSVYSGHMNDEMLDLFQEVQPQFQELYGKLEDILAGMQEMIDLDRPDISVRPGFSDKSKLPGYSGRIGGGLGGIGGLVIGTMFGGPVGGAIGGLAGALLGSLGGAGIGKIHSGIQKEDAKKELFEHIGKHHKIVEKAYLDVSKRFFVSTKAAIYGWLDMQEEIAKKQFEDRLADLKKPVEEKQRLAEQIRADIDELKACIRGIGGSEQ